MRKLKEPTSTSIVEETLRTLDDFVTAPQLRDLTGLDTCHLSASLCHLRKYSAADCIDADGQLYWYATPDTDVRTKVLLERTPESKPRRTRRTKKKGDV